MKVLMKLTQLHLQSTVLFQDSPSFTFNLVWDLSLGSDLLFVGILATRFHSVRLHTD